MRIAVIGSGIAAVSAIKALNARSVKPTVLDVGLELDNKLMAFADELAAEKPEFWNDEQRQKISANTTVNESGIPKKLLFGSDFFYGKHKKIAAVYGQSALPPFSYAKGGLSVGWGAAVLPAANCDLNNWPINNQQLEPYYKKSLETIPYSARDDELSLNFPIYSHPPRPLINTAGNISCLKALQKSGLLQKDKLVFGQARLLTASSDSEDFVGCKYCGICMSGCVYKSIYKANDDIDKFITQNKIDYVPNAHVIKLIENGSKVDVLFFNEKTKKINRMAFDRVFLGAGAVNSTRIIFDSLELYDHKINLKVRGGFVVPLFKFQGQKIEWPRANTQPGIFLEFKVPKLSKHWVHTQLSTPNEMVFQRLKFNPNQGGIVSLVKKWGIEHLMLAFCNMHSSHADDYRIWLESTQNQTGSTLKYARSETKESDRAIKLVLKELLAIGLKIGSVPLLPFVQKNSGSYHVGGTMPMKNSPQSQMETDIFGTPPNFKRVHVVDSSVFPSLPGTTIGLLSMANASRIASEVVL